MPSEPKAVDIEIRIVLESASPFHEPVSKIGLVSDSQEEDKHDDSASLQVSETTEFSKLWDRVADLIHQKTRELAWSDGMFFGVSVVNDSWNSQRSLIAFAGIYEFHNEQTLVSLKQPFSHLYICGPQIYGHYQRVELPWEKGTNNSSGTFVDPFEENDMPTQRIPVHGRGTEGCAPEDDFDPFS